MRTWSWDLCGPLELLTFLVLVGISDGASSPALVEIASTAELSWADTLPDPPAGFVRFYRIHARDEAGNVGTSCPEEV